MNENQRAPSSTWAQELLALQSRMSTAELVNIGHGPMSIEELLTQSERGARTNTAISETAAIITLATRAWTGDLEARNGLILIACTGELFECVEFATKLLCFIGRLEDFRDAAPQMFTRARSDHPIARRYWARRLLWIRHAVSNLGADITDVFPREQQEELQALIAEAVQELRRECADSQETFLP